MIEKPITIYLHFIIGYVFQYFHFPSQIHDLNIAINTHVALLHFLAIPEKKMEWNYGMEEKGLGT